jgi:hypothetical protein
MTSLDLRSHKVQLIGTAIAASLATATLLISYNTLSRRKRRKYLEENIQRSLAEYDADASSQSRSRTDEGIDALSNRENIQRSLAEYDADTSSQPRSRTDEDIDALSNNFSHAYDEELIREQLARNYAFFSEESMAKIRSSRVVIIGAGGVGSWAAVMLARS